MAAPAHNPAQNPYGTIHLRPEIIIDPNYRYVQPNAASPQQPPSQAPTGAPSSYEAGVARGFEQGREFKRNGGEQMSAKSDDKGHAPSIPAGVQTAFWWLAAALLALFVIGYSAEKIHRFVDPDGWRRAERQRLIDERELEEERARIGALSRGRDRERDRDREINRGDGGGAGYPRTNSGTGRALSPSPEEVYRRQLQGGNVTRTRIPCAGGFDTLQNGNCGRWVPD